MSNDMDAEWARAKKLCRLSAEDVRKAKELGFSPNGLIKNIPSPSQRWKAPVRVWVQDLHAQRFPRKAELAGSRAEREPRKASRHPDPQTAVESDPVEPTDEFDDAFLVREAAEGDDDWLPGPPEDDSPQEENRRLLWQRDSFLAAADYVTVALSRLVVVQRVTLFGSLAAEPRKRPSRLRRFRQAGVMRWDECKDVDLAVWVSDVGSLNELRRGIARAVDELLRDTGRGVAHHQVDVFLLEPGSDRYLGRLCVFGVCPKPDKAACRVPGCGAAPFLRQLEDFELEPQALAAERVRVLFDRQQALGPPSLERWQDADPIPF